MAVTTISVRNVSSNGVRSAEGMDHWLIKRSIKDGKVVSSTTERISPRMRKSIKIEDLLKKSVNVDEFEKQMPGAFN